MALTYRLGIDIGGTFTDLVLMNERTGDMLTLKTPSVPRDPARAVLNGVRELIDQHGIDPAEIGYFVHGTTIAVNTVIERSGSLTGLLVTRGFKDILEIGRLRLPDPTNYFVEKPKPLTPRKLVGEIGERLLANGRVFRPLDLAEVDRAVRELLALGVQAIAICFMHAYKSDQHERQAAAYIRETFPGLYVCTSAEIWPQQREFERALVTVINAHVGQRMRDYFDHLERNVAELRLPATIFTTKSNGGVMTAHSASEVPVETLLSGPASGVMGAFHIGQLTGHRRLITLDMGGTSADVAIIDEDVVYSTENQVGDFPVIMPAVDVSSIGAGGGSIAWVDSSGILKVGPRSAGADPGPAAYGRGGEEPTVTDAYVQLGFIQPEHFLGGRLRLDAARAEAALAKIGAPLGFDAIQTAASIVDVTTANMYAKFTPLMARKGIDPRDFAVLAYGGAGPTHACLLAREVGIREVIVPQSPGTLCALGCLMTDLKSDFVKTLYVESHAIDTAALEQEYRQLEERADAWLTAQSAETTSRHFLRSADMRYKGQSFEITVPLPGTFPEGTDMAAIRGPFHASYGRIYGFADAHAPVEIINLRVSIVGETPKPDYRARRDGRDAAATGELGAGAESPTSRPRPTGGSRRVLEYRQWVTAQVFQREALAVGSAFQGPAIVEANDTTVYVPTGFSATVDAWGNLVARDAATPET